MLVEWHQPPDYIVNNWTEELLSLMIEKMVERKKREADAFSGASRNIKSSGSAREVSDTELFARMGKSAKVVKQKDV